MFLVIFSIILFILTLPMKTVVLGLKLKNKTDDIRNKINDTKEKINEKDRKRAEELGVDSGNKEESDKPKKSKKPKGKLLGRFKRNKGKSNNAVNFAKKSAKVAVKLTIKTAKLLITLLRLIAMILGSLGVVGIIIAFFLILAVIAAVVVATMTGNTIANKDSTSVTVTNKNNKGNSSLSAHQGNPEECLEALGKWYIDNFDTYSKHLYGDKKCTLKGVLKGKGMRDDCTGFAGAYAALVDGYKKYSISTFGYSKTMARKDSILGKIGWEWHSIVKEDLHVKDLEPGDILVCNYDVDNGKGHHAECIVEVKKNNKVDTFGWGSVKYHYPSSKNVTFTRVKNGISDGGSHIYTCVWRYMGSSKKGDDG